VLEEERKGGRKGSAGKTSFRSSSSKEGGFRVESTKMMVTNQDGKQRRRGGKGNENRAWEKDQNPKRGSIKAEWLRWGKGVGEEGCE